MATEEFDVIAQMGDMCGGQDGRRSVRTIGKMLRNHFPTKPIITVLGNHDFWLAGKKKPERHDDYMPNQRSFHHVSMPTWKVSLDGIQQDLKELNIHFLDKDGPFRLDGWTFVGHTLWYGNMNPPTNDDKYMPLGVDGDTHKYLYSTALKELDVNLAQLTPDDINLVFCSHFPIVNFVNHGDHTYGGPEFLGKIMREEFKINYFLNGHAHQFHNGPDRFEAGSDYEKPKYLIVSL